MSVAKKQSVVSEISEQEYLTGEQISEVKHELIDGQVYAMAGAAINHERICSNLLRRFGNHLDNSPCEPLGSDMLVKAGSNFFYPDVSVDCDFDNAQPNYSQTPVLIVEVLSKSTRRTDQTTKRLSYINIPSLQEYVLIEQDFVQIEIARRRDNWRPSHYFLGDEVTFESIGLTLPVEEVYHRVHNEQMIEWAKEQQAQKSER